MSFKREGREGKARVFTLLLHVEDKRLLETMAQDGDRSEASVFRAILRQEAARRGLLVSQEPQRDAA